MEMPRDLVARRSDLIGMRRGQDRRCDRIGTIILQPVEPHVGTRFQDFDIDLIGEIFDIEHALVVDGHFSGQLSVRENWAWRDWWNGRSPRRSGYGPGRKHRPKSTGQRPRRPEAAAGAAAMAAFRTHLAIVPSPFSSLLLILHGKGPWHRQSLQITVTARHVDNPAVASSFGAPKVSRTKDRRG